jgi:hypothetical protein
LQSGHIVYLHVLKKLIVSNVSLSASMLSFVFHPWKILYTHDHLHLNKILKNLCTIIQSITICFLSCWTGLCAMVMADLPQHLHRSFIFYIELMKYDFHPLTNLVWSTFVYSMDCSSLFSNIRPLLGVVFK